MALAGRKLGRKNVDMLYSATDGWEVYLPAAVGGKHKTKCWWNKSELRAILPCSPDQSLQPTGETGIVGVCVCDVENLSSFT